mmetsp:Transcript_10385/g.29199  ORF Transcript_10385/g.29199 Transcript_10385/m.29199 type:complete len:137 (-) Transcript_10385:100-510(-)
MCTLHLKPLYPVFQEMIPLRFSHLSAPRSPIPFGSFVFVQDASVIAAIAELSANNHFTANVQVFHRPPALQNIVSFVVTYRTPSSQQETRCYPASRCSGVILGVTENCCRRWGNALPPPPRMIAATMSRVIDDAAA